MSRGDVLRTRAVALRAKPISVVLAAVAASIAIAVPAPSVPAFSGEAEASMYCTRHKARCRARDAAQAIQAELAAERERQFRAGLTAEQLAEVDRRDKEWLEAWKTSVAHSEALRRKIAELEKRPPRSVVAFFVLLGVLGGWMLGALLGRTSLRD